MNEVVNLTLTIAHSNNSETCCVQRPDLEMREDLDI